MFLVSTTRWHLAGLTVTLIAVAVLCVIAWRIVATRRTRSERTIDFEPVPIPAAHALREDIAPHDFIDFVDVRRVAFAVRRGRDLTGDVWITFANNPHERSFRNLVVTTETFGQTLAAYQAKLVAKASSLSLPSHTLKACLDSIEPSGHLAVLPVGAYLARYAGDDIWILVCKWENMSPDRPVHLSHVRVWALRAADQQVLTFQTCM